MAMPPGASRACSASVPAGHPSYQRCDHERIFSNALGGTSCDSHRHYDGEPRLQHSSSGLVAGQTLRDVIYERASLRGYCCRRILIFALETNDQNLLSPAVTMTAKTAAGTPNESIATLRRCISPERLAQDGYLTLRALSAAVLVLLPVDTDFVREVDVAAFGYRETNTDATSISDSQVLPMRSNRRQDYEGGLWMLRSISRGSCECRRATRSAHWLQLPTTSLRSNTTRRWINYLSPCGWRQPLFFVAGPQRDLGQ